MIAETAPRESFYTKGALNAVSTNELITRGKTAVNTRLYLSADNKRCSRRRAARTSFGRSRRPALVAYEYANPMDNSRKPAEFDRRGGIEQ